MPTYLRLFPATNQFELKNGALNVAGHLYVYYNETDDLADIFDENGTQLQQPAILDNNGRARGLFVDASRVYRLEVYDQFDGLVYTVRKMVPSGGGAGSALGKTYEVVSSDGSIAVDKFDDGGVVTYDLSANVEDGSDLLEWIRCDGGVSQSGKDIVKPTYSAGTMLVGSTGIQVKANAYYHVTAHLRATKSDVDAYYDNVYVLFSLGNEPVTRQSVIIDYSMGLSQDFEVSTDVKVDADAELNLSIIGASNAGDVELLNMEMHRIYSGTPVIPGGVQRTLIAGANITIEHTGAGDVISSTGGGTTEYTAGTGIVVDNTEHTISVANNVVIDGSYVHTDANFTTADASKLSGIEAGAQANVQSDWDVNDASSDAYIRNRPDLSQYATQSDLADYQPLLTAGTGIDITNNTISVDNTVAMKSDLPDLTDYVTESELQTTLSDYATDTELSNGLATKQDVLTAGSNIAISGSTISATDTTYSAGTGLNLSGTEFSVDSTVVAMKSDLPDLTDYVTDTDLQTILQGYQEALTAGSNISISNGVISATDTTYSAGSGLSLNGTTFSVDTATIATKSDLSGKQDTLTAGNGIDITSNVVSAKVDGSTITTNANGELVATGSSFTQLQSNWNENNPSSVQFILNKPTIPTVPTMKELVAGAGITLTENTNDVTVASTITQVTIGTVTV